MFDYPKVSIYNPNKMRWPDRSLSLLWDLKAQRLPACKLGHSELAPEGNFIIHYVVLNVQ